MNIYIVTFLLLHKVLPLSDDSPFINDCHYVTLLTVFVNSFQKSYKPVADYLMTFSKAITAYTLHTRPL